MASRGINKVILVGHLGNDPEIRYMPSGSAMANITLATSESWRDKNTGEQKEKTEWHRVALFGKLAEIAGEYLKKGSQVYIEGQLQTRKWQDQSGQDRYTTEVVVQGYTGIMQMLGGRQQQGMTNNFAGANNGMANGGAGNNSWGAPQQMPNQAQQQAQPQQQNQWAGQNQAPNQYQQTASPQQQAPTQSYNDTPDFDDDIPF